MAGGAYHFGTLLALEMATGWDPDDAEVIVGTSSGAFVAAMVRGKAMDFQSMADASLAGMDLAGCTVACTGASGPGAWCAG